MALYVGVACSRRRDLFKLCPHRRFTFTSGQSLITPTYDFCYKRRAIRTRSKYSRALLNLAKLLDSVDAWRGQSSHLISLSLIGGLRQPKGENSA